LPSFDIVKSIEPEESFRVASIRGAFDFNPAEVKERFIGDIEIEGKDWNVGLIVGGSGTGKSTIAKEIFPDHYISGFDYSAKSVVDDMPKGKSIKDIELAFVSVGFSSPPSWLKPYAVLSNGERMRADLARSILEERDLIVFDEFTSVVNREVAKTGSYAISKAARRLGKQFIAVSCHKDITDWLEPDWIYDTDVQQFFFIRKTSDPKAQTLSWKSSGLTTQLKNGSGKFLGSIII
jgi:ABC-type ATPase with predicted acetyltransferase domain